VERLLIKIIAVECVWEMAAGFSLKPFFPSMGPARPGHTALRDAAANHPVSTCASPGLELRVNFQ